jgi:hypothetical protein
MRTMTATTGLDTLIAEAADRPSPFRLTHTGLQVIREPTLKEWLDEAVWLQSVADGVQWWLADLLAYGKNKPGWEEKWTQALTATGLAEKTLSNYIFVGENVPPSRRREAKEGASFSHHAAVASLSPARQVEVLTAVVEDHLTVRETYQRVKEVKGVAPEFWLEVKCLNRDDQQILAQRLANEGRLVQVRRA